MLILKNSSLQNLFILIFLIILSGNPNTSFSDPIAEITADIATDITIRHITPNTVRYGKKTDIDVIFKKNTTITRAFLSPGGPYISDSLKKYLPAFAAINDTLITNNKIFIATKDGDILSLSINNKNQARNQTSVSKIHVNSPVLKLVYLESRIFALTQSGFLYSIKLPSFKVENKIRIEGKITDIATANNYLYLLQNNKKLLIYKANSSTKPTLTAEYEIKNHAVRIFANEKYCFLATEKNGLVLLHIKNSSEIRAAGRFNTSGIVNDVVVKNNIAYVADGPIGLTVLDVSKPTKIAFLGSNNKLGTVSRVAINNSRILVTNTENKLTLLDISKPEAPAILSSFQSNRNIKKIHYYEQSAVVTLSDDINMINISAETSPPVNSEGVTLGGSRRAVIENNIMYVADWFSGLHIYDVSDPLNIKHIANYHTKGSSKGVVIKDNYAFVGDDDHGLQIINVSDPKAPVWVSKLATTGLAYTMKIDGNILYLADHHGGFHIIDIADIKHPKRLGGIDTPGKAWAIDVHENTAYVADDLSGLLIFDVSSHNNPQQIAKFSPGGFAEDVKIKDNKAFVTFFDTGLYILDIKSPNNPKLISHLPIPGNARGIELDNNIAYISAWYAGVQIVNIENVTSPEIIGYYDTDGATWGTSKKDDYIFALDWWGGIKTINVGNSHNPILTSRYHAKNTVIDLATKGNYTYTANGKSGLQVFDTTNALNPMWVTALELSDEVGTISIHDSYAYMASQKEIYIVDIKNPFYPNLVTTLRISNTISSLGVYKNHIYILDKTGNLIIYNISITDTPKLIATEIATKNIGAINFWIIDNALVASNKKKELLFYSINENGLITLADTYVANTSVESINVFNKNVFIYTEQGNRILTLSKNKNGYEEVSSTQLDEIIFDMKISGNTLYATGNRTGLIAFTINNDKDLIFKNAYPSANKIKRFAVNKNRVFFAGDKLLSTLNLLPNMSSIKSSSTKLSVNIPGNMPLGIYNLMFVKNDKTTHKISNSISVELPNFKKPQFKK